MKSPFGNMQLTTSHDQHPVFVHTAPCAGGPALYSIWPHPQALLKHARGEPSLQHPHKLAR